MPVRLRKWKIVGRDGGVHGWCFTARGARRRARTLELALTHLWTECKSSGATERDRQFVLDKWPSVHKP